MPYALQKGVYSEWDIKNKPTYGNDNIANTTVYAKGNSRGVLKSVADNNGVGIVYPCDKLNIITAHKTLSSTHDQQELGSIRKLELVFTRVLVERQTQEKWPDIWEAIACHELDSDQIYKGITYLGPNFNPRPESVQIITPVQIQSADVAASTVFQRFTHDKLAQHASETREQNPFEESVTSSAVQPPEPIDPNKCYILDPPVGETFEELVLKKNRKKRHNFCCGWACFV